MPEQEDLLARTFGGVRFVYNAVLRYRMDAFCQRQEKIGYVAANAYLSKMKKAADTAFLNDVSCVPLQQGDVRQNVSLRIPPLPACLHLKNIFSDEDLAEEATTKGFLVVRQEGRRQVRRNIQHHNH